MRKRLLEPRPGDMIDGASIPEYWGVSHIRELLSAVHWKQHALVDLPWPVVRRTMADTNRRIRYLCNYLYKPFYLVLNVVLYDLALQEMCVGVQICSGQKIIQYLQMTKNGWRYGRDQGPWQPNLRTDILWRKLMHEDREQRDWERFVRADKLSDTISKAHFLDETARDTCFYVSYDGFRVSENLHGGGIFHFVAGKDGFMPPASLVGMQAQHDRIYHPRLEDGLIYSNAQNEQMKA